MTAENTGIDVTTNGYPNSFAGNFHGGLKTDNFHINNMRYPVSVGDSAQYLGVLNDTTLWWFDSPGYWIPDTEGIHYSTGHIGVGKDAGSDYAITGKNLNSGGKGVFGWSSDSYGVHGYSTSGVGVFGYSYSNHAIWGHSIQGYAGYFEGGRGIYSDSIRSTSQVTTEKLKVGSAPAVSVVRNMATMGFRNCTLTQYNNSAKSGDTLYFIHP